MKFKLDKKKSMKIVAGALAITFLGSCAKKVPTNFKNDETISINQEEVVMHSITYLDDDCVKMIDFVESYIKYIPRLEDKDNYIFNGWYLNNSPYNFHQIINSDVVLTANWLPRKNLCYLDIKNIISIQNNKNGFNDCYLDVTDDISTLFLQFYNVSDFLEVSDILNSNPDAFEYIYVELDITSKEDITNLKKLPKSAIYKLNIFNDFTNESLDLENINVKTIGFYENAKLSDNDLQYLFNTPNVSIIISSNTTTNDILNKLNLYGNSNIFDTIEIGIKDNFKEEINLPLSKYTLINNGSGIENIVIKANSEITVIEACTDNFIVLVPDESTVYIDLYRNINLESPLLKNISNSSKLYLKDTSTISEFTEIDNEYTRKLSNISY